MRKASSTRPELFLLRALLRLLGAAGPALELQRLFLGLHQPPLGLQVRRGAAPPRLLRGLLRRRIPEGRCVENEQKLYVGQ